MVGGCRMVEIVPVTQIAKSAMRTARKSASGQDGPCARTEVRRMEAANSSHPAAAMPQRTGDPRKVGHCSRSRPLSSFAFSFMGSPLSSAPPPYVVLLLRTKGPGALMSRGGAVPARANLSKGSSAGLAWVVRTLH